MHPDFKHRYSVLAPEESKSSSEARKCSEAILKKLVKDGVLTDENFRMGETKVFFKAGVLAHLEDVRDECLKAIMTKFQAYVRWYLGLTDRKRRIEQKAGLLILQRNVRSWCSLRSWPWFVLYTKVRPMLKEGKIAEEMEKLTDKLKALEENLIKEEKLRKDLDENSKKMEAEKSDLFAQLESTKAALIEAEARVQNLDSSKAEADRLLEVRL